MVQTALRRTLIVLLAVALGPWSTPAGEETPEEIARLVERERVRSSIEGAYELVLAVDDDLAVDYQNLYTATQQIVELGPAAVEFLAPQLDSVSPREVMFTIYALGRLGVPEAVPPLRDLIERSNERGDDRFNVNRKAWTCLALAMLGQDDAVDLLDSGGVASGYVELSRGMSFRDGTAVLTAPASAARLAAQIDRHQPEANRLERRGDLVKALGWVAGDSMRPKLLELSRDADLVTRERALVALGGLGPHPTARARLLEALADPVEGIRRAAARGLENAGLREIPEELLSRLDVEENATVRSFLYRLVAEVQGEDGLATLVRHWGRPDGLDRMWLIEAVGLGRMRNGVNLMKEGLNDPDARVGVRAVQGLVDIGTPAAHETLLAAMRNPDWSVRLQAAAALSAERDRRVAPRAAALLLDDLLTSSDPLGVRRHRVAVMCELIERYGYLERFDEIRQAAVSEPDVEIKNVLETTAKRLALVAEHGDDRAWWYGALESPERGIRGLALRRLADRGDDAAIAAMVAAFDDADDVDRVRILREVGWAGSSVASDLVERVLDDPEFDPVPRRRLRDEAAWVARVIGGQRMIAALRRSAERREGRDYKVLVYLGLLAGEDALDTLRGVRAPRLHYPRWDRGQEQEQLEWMIRRLEQGRSIHRLDLPPERLEFFS